MTAAEFVARHPEFATASEDAVDATLADAELCVSDRFGAQRDQVIALTAAAQLAISPAGRAARLSYETKGGKLTSTYELRLERLKGALACGTGRIV